MYAIVLFLRLVGPVHALPHWYNLNECTTKYRINHSFIANIIPLTIYMSNIVSIIMKYPSDVLCNIQIKYPCLFDNSTFELSECNVAGCFSIEAGQYLAWVLLNVDVDDYHEISWIFGRRLGIGYVLCLYDMDIENWYMHTHWVIVY